MANLVLTTPTNPGDADWVDITAILPAGGTILIPDGGSIGGVYEANVLCLGSVYITADIQVSGDLIVNGNVYAPSPVEIFVQGDFICGKGDPGAPPGNIYIINGVFTDVWPASPFVNWNTTGTDPQKNITVGGDFTFSSLFFPQTGGTSAALTVGGSVVGIIDCSAVLIGGIRTPAGSLSVSGNFKGNIVALGNANSPFTTYCTEIRIKGNCVGTIIAESDGNIGPNAVGGGFVEISGDAALYQVNMRGLSNDQGPGGAGGTLIVNGNARIAGIYAGGGSCTSDNPSHISGSGGFVYVTGHLSSFLIDMASGYRTGNPPLTGSKSIVYGGTILAESITCTYINLSGGDVFAGAPVQTGGFGGTINCRGSLVCSQIYANGGFDQSANSYPGYGGTINAGSIISDSGIYMQSGRAYTSGTFSFNGGGINCDGSVSCPEIDLRGVDASSSGWGGGGGNLSVTNGNVNVGILRINGGTCNTSFNASIAGPAGNLIISNGNLVADQVYASAGNRLGATTIAQAISGKNGGTLTVNGNCNIRTYLELRGSEHATSFPFGPAGSGGTLTVKGTLFCYEISGGGGNSAGAAAGSAATLTVDGFVTGTANFNLQGGTSYISPSGAPASTPGRGAIASFASGCVLSTFDAQNGSGTGSPPAPARLELGGSCNIYNIAMSTSGLIKSIFVSGSTYRLVELRVLSLSPKQTFNNGDNTTTAVITAFLPNNLFFTTSSGQWYRIQGTGTL